MTNEHEVRSTSEQFYTAAKAVLRDDAAPMLAVWSHREDASYCDTRGEIVMGWPALEKKGVDSHHFMHQIIAPLIFGLSASLCWGSGDFSGGMASRRANVLSVVIGDYIVGLVLLVLLALVWREPFPSAVDLLWGGLAGLAGVLGLISCASGPL
jgi:hypothetical protein